MPGLSFLNPAYLAGLALLILPIAIHFLVKRTVREIPFSDLRFLREAVVKRRRSFQLENRNLLMMRLLVLSLLILAVAKPVIRLAKTRVVQESDRTQAVIILDDSCSMRCLENGVERFDRAKQAALAVLRGLRDEDRVTLILASSQTEIAYNQMPVFNLETRSRLESLTPSWKASDLSQALTMAEELLKEAEADHKEVYLLTDAQRSAFEKVYPRESKPDAEQIDLYYIEVGYPDTGNLALNEIDFRPRRAGPGTECQIAVRGFAYGKVAPKFTALRLLKLGGGATETNIPIVPNSAFTQTFRETIREEGYWLAEAKIDDNVLEADNQRYLVIPVEQPGRLLLVDGEPRRERRDWETFYFERALKVYATGVSGGRSYEVFVQGVGDSLDQLDTSGFDVIVLANVPQISREVVRKLENFVQRGGSLIVSLGNRIDLQYYREIIAPKLIPCQFERIVRSGERPPFRISAFLDKEKPLEIFSESKQGDLTLPLFTGYVALDFDENSTGRVLARFDTSAVALMEVPIGRGKVIVWTSSLDTDWNDLPLRPLYLPFWGEILEYLEDTSSPPTNVEIGQTVELTMDFGPEAHDLTSLQVLMPGDQSERFQVDPTQGSFRTYFTQTLTPGFYRLQSPSETGLSRVFPEVFAVNVAAEESNLARVDSKEVEDRLTGWNVSRIEPTHTAAAQLLAARKGLAVWDILLLLLMIGLAIETIYANRVWR